MKTKPKRIKRWVNAYTGVIAMYPTASQARAAGRSMEPRRLVERVAVPLIELRRGEVVVNVEELMEELDALWPLLYMDKEDHEEIRDAIKKVGVR